MSVSSPAAVIVLAAGEGTRMKSTTPKVLHTLCGRTLLGHVLAAAAELDPENSLVVVGHGREQVVTHLAAVAPQARAVVQQVQRGTGHAVRIAVEELDLARGQVLVTYGDMPLLRGRTLQALARQQAAAGDAVTVLTARVADPSGYGRIVRDDAGALAAIIEDADATGNQRAIDEINSGCYAFDGALLADAVKRIAVGASGQEYLTDVVAILRGDGHRVGTVRAEDPTEVQGVNDRVQLASARRLYNQRLLEGWMRAGVTVVDPVTTWIDADVILAPDVEIGPWTQLEGRTSIASGARVGPGCVLRDTSVSEAATVINAVCHSAEIGPGASVGPFAYLRPGTRLESGAHVGTYVEVKNAVVGEGTKVPHLTYVGDADIGVGSNIGASTVFVNYDGVAKHHTTVGDHVRIGSDTMLVAPVTVGDGAYTAAGSVITRDVPPGTLAIARAEQHNSGGWVERKRPGTASAAAATRARSATEGASAADGGIGPTSGSGPAIDAKKERNE